MSYFIRPPMEAYDTLEGPNYFLQYRTYSEYNYLRPGLFSLVKIRHFETALRLTKTYFRRCNVIDFGCADGVFLPSLSKYFNRVVGIDRNPGSIKICEGLVNRLSLGNVKLMCNDGLTVPDVRSNISGEGPYQILYLLETLEHVGDKGSLYQSRIDFLRDIATLLDEDGIMVISVPTMVGLAFLLQRIGLGLFKLPRDQMTVREILKASLLNNTTDIEKRWDQSNLGFNHRKLERFLGSAFQILVRKDIFFQVVYVVKPRTPVR
jgi:2-polyprenyl-3-methyl-5-hydroxy-6-metoxy-1,4-benzoquinol methylase